MDILLTKPESESFPKLQKENIHNRHLGILTSEFKLAATRSYSSHNKKTIYGNKQLAKSRLYQLNSGVEFALRIGVFLALFSFLF